MASDGTRDTTDFRFTGMQLDVFAGWRRPNEALSVECLKTDRYDVKDIAPTMVPSSATDLVQDMTADCSLVASLCAVMARAEAGHTKARWSMWMDMNRLTWLRLSLLSCTRMTIQV